MWVVLVLIKCLTEFDRAFDMVVNINTVTTQMYISGHPKTSAYSFMKL